MNEIPEIIVKVVPTENHPTGLGQMATPLVGSGDCQRGRRARGRAVRETPITPERVRKAGGKVMASQFGFEEQGNERD
jgi:isoquinoline 1-oxidoreductase beta subunit